MRNYVKLHAWDYLLTVLIAVGMHLNVFSAFMIRESYMHNYLLVAVVTAVAMAIMFLIGYSKRNAIVGGVGWGIALVVWVIFLRAKGLIDLSGESDETIPAFWTILLFGSAIIYLLTRSQKVLYAAAPVGLLFCGAFRFLDYPVSVPGLFLMVIGILLEILYLVYRDSLLNASYGNFNLRHFVVQSVAIATVVTLLASGVFYGIVKPLDSPTRDLKLITKLMSFDILELLGVSSTQELKEPDQDDRDNDESEEEKDKEEEEKEEQEEEQNRESQEDVSASTVSYDEERTPPYWIGALVLLLLGLPFAVKYGLRARRRRRLNGLDASNQAAFVYDFFLKRFHRLGIGKTDSQTILEYAEQQEGVLESFTASDGTTFAEVSDLYNRFLYSKVPLTSEEAGKFLAIYQSFYKNARAFVGPWKYLLKFWVL